MRTVLILLIALGVLLSLPIARSTRAAEVIVEATDGTETKQQSSEVAVTFRSPAPGHLFTAGTPIDLTAVITSRVAQRATLYARVTTAYGTQLALESKTAALSAGKEVTFPIAFDRMERLPNGTYQVEAWVEGEQGANSGATTFSVWSGPLERRIDSAGISYAGPLNTARTWQDLELFKMAGVGWLRFPLQGWLPQGQAVPAEVEEYNMFVQEAGQRDFNLLAAFTPKVTVDPGVNELQAGKEYRESLLAAAARYSFKVKNWELLTVKPDPRYQELKGIRFQDLAQYAPSLKATDKTCRVIFSVENPLKWNALELFNSKIPAKDDILGMRYNLYGIPEFRSEPVSPAYSLDEVIPSARTYLKHTPPVWVTEYGFDPQVGERMPEPPMQAALLARALLINRGANIERTFWRYDPTEAWNVPFISKDGSTRANYLALRTTLQMLDGVTSVHDVPCPQLTINNKVWALLLRYDVRKQKSRYLLATWLETRDSRLTTSLTIKTGASRVTVTDLWGNAIELQPVSNAAAFTVDAFPRFVDLGTFGDAEIYSPFAYFKPAGIVLTEDGENRMGLVMHNDQRLFRGDINCEVYLRRWPGKEGELAKRQIDLGPADSATIPWGLEVPEGAQRGELYRLSADIMLGTRRIGYLTVPVWYIPKAEAEKEETK
jgi:hypothetical protein